MPEPLRDLAQQPIPGIVAKAVVHLLEAIEVDEEDGNQLVGAFGPSESLIEPITEQSSIRQTGQVVVECLVCQLLFELDSFRDVSRIENDATDPPLLAQVGHMRLQVPPFAGCVEHSKDDLRRATVNGCRLHRLAVVRVQDRFEATTEKLGFTAINHPRYGAAHIATSVGAEHQDEIGGRGDKAPEVGGLPSRRENQSPTQQK